MPLIVKPISATLVKDTDFFGKSDPYAIILVGNQKQRSRTCNGGGKKPSWTDTFQFSSTDPLLRVQVYDEDLFTRDDFIGEGTISLGQFYGSPMRTENGKSAGRILLSIEYQGPPIGNQNYNQGWGNNQQWGNQWGGNQNWGSNQNGWGNNNQGGWGNSNNQGGWGSNNQGWGGNNNNQGGWGNNSNGNNGWGNQPPNQTWGGQGGWNGNQGWAQNQGPNRGGWGNNNQGGRGGNYQGGWGNNSNGNQGWGNQGPNQGYWGSNQGQNQGWGNNQYGGRGW